MKCTCGSVAVGHPGHSDYCDFDKTLELDALYPEPSVRIMTPPNQVNPIKIAPNYSPGTFPTKALQCFCDPLTPHITCAWCYNQSLVPKFGSNPAPTHCTCTPTIICGGCLRRQAINIGNTAPTAIPCTCDPTTPLILCKHCDDMISNIMAAIP